MSDNGDFDKFADLTDAIRKVYDAHIVYTLATNEKVLINAESAAKAKLNEVNKLLPKMEEELAHPELGFPVIISCLRSIRQDLDELNRPPRPTLTKLIESNVDVDPICEALVAASQNADVNPDLNGLLSSTLDCMAAMCSKARDVNIDQLRKVDSVPKKIGGIMVTLKEMAIDMANFMINAVKGTCTDQWKPWFREKFDEIIQLTSRHGIDILEDTKKWLKDTRLKHPNVDKQQLVKYAFADLLKPAALSSFPCTLEFEVKTLLEVKNSIYSNIIHKCIVLIGKELKIAWPPAVDNDIKVLLADYPKSPLEQVLADVSSQIKHRVCPEDVKLVEAISRLSQLEQHPLFNVLFNRVLQAFLQMINCRKTSEAAAILEKSALDDDLRELVFQFYVGCAVNLFVFDDVYQSICDGL